MMAMEEETASKASLYAEYRKIYPRSVRGFFRRLKALAAFLILAVYFLLPFLRWDRGEGMPDQAILIDLAARRFHFFSIEIWPQEIYYLTGLLVLAAVGLFLATALLGRVWCGFACPQTVWTDLLLLIERGFEGDRSARIKRDHAPWTAGKILRKTVKHLLWLAIALLTGIGWVLYFDDAPTLLPVLLEGKAATLVYVCIAVLAAFAYLLGGWAREQVCIYMCPWPRIQGGMLDEHSMIVTYQAWRGEPRAHLKKGRTREGAPSPENPSAENRPIKTQGDCIDCSLCVQVCPTGTDIRNGTQLSCIGCALCVDACNAVMRKLGRPGGLITYDSTVRQTARAAGKPPSLRLIRPRTVLYVVVMIAVGALMAYVFSTRPSTGLTILQQRNPLFVQQTDGSIRNGYVVKIANMRSKEQTFHLRLEGIEDALMTVVGRSERNVEQAELPVRADTITAYKVFVSVPADRVPHRFQDIVFIISDETGRPVIRTVATFAAPGL